MEVLLRILGILRKASSCAWLLAHVGHRRWVAMGSWYILFDVATCATLQRLAMAAALYVIITGFDWGAIVQQICCRSVTGSTLINMDGWARRCAPCPLTGTSLALDLGATTEALSWLTAGPPRAFALGTACLRASEDQGLDRCLDRRLWHFVTVAALRHGFGRALPLGESMELAFDCLSLRP